MRTFIGNVESREMATGVARQIIYIRLVQTIQPSQTRTRQRIITLKSFVPMIFPVIL